MDHSSILIRPVAPPTTYASGAQFIGRMSQFPYLLIVI